MAAPIITALEQALHHGSSEKGYFWIFQHPNPDAPPQTFRVTRRAGNGWAQLLVASKETKEVLSFYAELPEDQESVKAALKWLGIAGQIETGADGTVLTLSSGKVIPSVLYGGEKPKVKK